MRPGDLTPPTWVHQVAFPFGLADAKFVLDQVEKLDAVPGGRFRGRLDLSRIGMLGFSYGGAMAVEMSIRDPRIKAAVDQDGSLCCTARTTGTSRPAMLMHNANTPESDTASHSPRAFMARSTGPVYDVTIARTHHGHFSDLSLYLYQDVFRDSIWIDPHRAHRIINAYTQEFFDHHLKNRPSDLLSGRATPFAEVTLKRKDPAPQ